jgi:two-component system NtrC family sensor kinase
MKIIWIEPQRNEREKWRRLLKRCGADACFVTNVQRAIVRIKSQQHWDLAIIPASLPTLDLREYLFQAKMLDASREYIVLCEQDQHADKVELPDIGDLNLHYYNSSDLQERLLRSTHSSAYAEDPSPNEQIIGTDTVDLKSNTKDQRSSALQTDQKPYTNTKRSLSSVELRIVRRASAPDLDAPVAMSTERERQLEEEIADLRHSLAEVKLSLSVMVDERTRQLEQAKREWEQTFDAINDPVLIIDSDYRIIRANLAFACIVNSDIRLLIGKTCYQHLMQRQEPCESCPLSDTLEQQEGRVAEIQHHNQYTIYHVRSFPLSDSRHVVHEYRDITEEKALQQMLIQAEKLSCIGLLAGHVAHEINNPLAAILAQTQLLLLDIEPDMAQHGPLRDIERAALRCRKIVQDLLNFARQKPADLRIRHELKPIIDQSLELYALIPPREGPRLSVELAPNLPLLRLDPDKIQSILLNLLSNAKSATDPKGLIELRVYRQEQEIAIIVRDSGHGIPPHLHKKIFMPFFTTKAPGLGTGLGLYIVNEIVKEHEGRLELDSHPNKGTEFRLFLPIQ